MAAMDSRRSYVGEWVRRGMVWRCRAGQERAVAGWTGRYGLVMDSRLSHADACLAGLAGWAGHAACASLPLAATSPRTSRSTCVNGRVSPKNPLHHDKAV